MFCRHCRVIPIRLFLGYSALLLCFLGVLRKVGSLSWLVGLIWPLLHRAADFLPMPSSFPICSIHLLFMEWPILPFPSVLNMVLPVSSAPCSFDLFLNPSLSYRLASFHGCPFPIGLNCPAVVAK